MMNCVGCTTAVNGNVEGDSIRAFEG